MFRRISWYTSWSTRLLKTGLLLMTNETQPLAKSVLIPLELAAAAVAYPADAGIHKKNLRI